MAHVELDHITWIIKLLLLWFCSEDAGGGVIEMEWDSWQKPVSLPENPWQIFMSISSIAQDR